jgi:macrolide-specific efflux system membrane fusion protein
LKRRFPTSRRTRVLLAAGAAGLLLVLYLLLKPDPPPQLATAAATIGDVEQTVMATGTIEARELVSVGAQASGQIHRLHVELGDEVAAGDLIAEIDATTQQNALRNAEAALANVRAQRTAQQAAVAEAEAAYERQRTMLAAEATSQAEYESARAQLVAARSQVESAEAQIAQAETTLATARANLGYTRITAPMAGTVVALVAREGQTVNAGLSTPTIVKLAQLDTVTIKAEISEADVVKVKPGQDVYFTILGDPDTRYRATLRTIEPAPASIQAEENAASASTSTAVYYNALFDVANPDGVLRIAMTAQVNVVLASASKVLTIPSTALGRKVGRDTWLVQVARDDGPPEERKVRIGIDNNVSAQVLAGLEAGERVVVGDAADAPADTQARARGMGGPPRMR